MHGPPTRNSNDWHARGDEGHWDGKGKIIVWGILLPTGLILWTLLDLFRGRAWIPDLSRRGGFGSGEWGVVFPLAADPWTFWGVVLIKLGAASIAFTVWVVGNHPTAGWNTEWIVLILCGFVGLGVLSILVGCVW